MFIGWSNGAMQNALKQLLFIWAQYELIEKILLKITALKWPI